MNRKGQYRDNPAPVYKGYRLQALYALYRILHGEEYSFQPEGVEDLAVYSQGGKLLEVVQVKDHTNNLTPSSFGEAFYKRMEALVTQSGECPVTLASYGPIGDLFKGALIEKISSVREKLINSITRYVKDKNVAERIVSCLRIEQVQEANIIEYITQQLTALCTGV